MSSFSPPRATRCVVILLDESVAMTAVIRDRVADGGVATKTNSDRIATAVNSLLRHLSDGPPCEIALVGYGANAAGEEDVGSRWRGELEGREFVPSRDLGPAATIEKRTRKVPTPDGGVAEEVVDFPVWYQPRQCVLSPQAAAFRFVAQILDRRKAAGEVGQPIIVHICGGNSSDGSPQIIVDELSQVDFGGEKPLFVQCHVASVVGQLTSAFPLQQALLPTGLARDLFSRASLMPEGLRAANGLGTFEIPPGARAVVHNGKMLDVVRCLNIARLHTCKAQSESPPQSLGSSSTGQQEPSAEVPTPLSSETSLVTGLCTTVHAEERPALAILVLDRSVTDPATAGLPDSYRLLKDAANEILRQLSSKPCVNLPIDVAIVSYGSGTDGQAEVRATFDGPLTGRRHVRTAELEQGAIRIEEKTVEMSNGAGGILSFTRRTPIHFDLPPAKECAPQPAFSAVAAIVEEWLAHHPGRSETVVLHLTRGRHGVADTNAAADLVAGMKTADAMLRIQHFVCTDSAHPSLLYPATDDCINDEGIRALWCLSSPLVDWERLRGTKRPYITAGARAFVVNGTFDTLTDELCQAIGLLQT